MSPIAALNFTGPPRFRLRPRAGRWSWLVVLGLCLGGLSTAQAHRLVVEWAVQGETLLVRGRTDAHPAGDAEVELRAPDGTLLAEGHLDPQGQFLWPLSAYRGDLTVTVNAGSGHRRTLTLHAAELARAAASDPAQTGARPDGQHPAPTAEPGTWRRSNGSEPLAVRVVLGLTFLLAAFAAWTGYRNRRRLDELERRMKRDAGRG